MVQHLSGGKYSFGDGNSVRKKLGKLVTKYGLVDELQGKREALKAWHKEVVEDTLNKYLVPFLKPEDISENGRKFLNFELDKKGNLPLPESGVLNWFVIGSTYLFSVIHSVAYSYISYNQLYQKYYHPLEFWAGALNSNSKEDVANYVSSAVSESKVAFYPPCVNRSEVKFSKENGGLRFGLSYVAGLDKASLDIIEERKKRGPYSNFVDFVQRTKQYRSVNKKVVTSLIFANAFEGEDPKDNYETYCKLKGETPELSWNKKDYTTREYEVLNCNVSYSPVNRAALTGTVPYHEVPDGSTVDVVVSVTTVTTKTTKTGKPYRLLQVLDCNNQSKGTVFLWDNSVNVVAGETYKTKLTKKGDFVSWSY